VHLVISARSAATSKTCSSLTTVLLQSYISLTCRSYSCNDIPFTEQGLPLAACVCAAGYAGTISAADTCATPYSGFSGSCVPCVPMVVAAGEVTLVGTFSASGSAECSANTVLLCAAGQGYVIGTTTSESACAACAAGTFSGAEDANICAPCATGRSVTPPKRVAKSVLDDLF
jgi:hypothetical protein